MLKLTTNEHEASSSLSVTAELLVSYPTCLQLSSRDDPVGNWQRYVVLEKLE